MARAMVARYDGECVKCNHKILEGEEILWEGRATKDQESRVARYTERLTGLLVDVATRALASRRPARLAWGRGRVGFGGNRRLLEDGKWRGFGFQRTGPVDHSLPVLVATSGDGSPLAIWGNLLRLDEIAAIRAAIAEHQKLTAEIEAQAKATSDVQAAQEQAARAAQEQADVMARPCDDASPETQKRYRQQIQRIFREAAL